MKLTELLLVIALIALLVALLFAAVARATRWSRSWIYGAYAHHENRIEAFLDDSTRESRLFQLTTNAVVPWSFVVAIPPGN